jgi:catechol 2,3-dioxygenase-like lactoylglutathione lyase family enzyme
MIDHLSLGTHRYAESVDFYKRVLAPLGMRLQRDKGNEAGFGTDERWCFWLYPVSEEFPVTAPGVHVALAADSRATVAAVHALALAAHATDITSPRARPDISATYFGAMFHDLDGHRVEILTNAA